MSRQMPRIALFFLLAVWLAASYGLRYGLMEDARWVGLCLEPASHWQCQFRSSLGLMIHFQSLAWAGLAAAVLAFIVPGRIGRALAVVALLPAIMALVLYTANIAVFAVVLAALRLVRRQA